MRGKATRIWSLRDKPRALILLALLSGLEGLAILAALLAFRPGGERLAAAGLLAGSLAALGLAAAAWLSPRAAAGARGWLEARIAHPDDRLTTGFLLLLGGLAAPALAGTAAALGGPRLAWRLLPLAAWGSLACLQALAALAVACPADFRDPGFYRGAPVRVARRLITGYAQVWAAAGVLLAAGAALYVSSHISLGLPPLNDSGIFLYFGRRILAGDVPFRDLWDHKPPLVFYVNALGLYLGGGSAWGVWLLEYLALAAGGLLGFALLRRYYRALPALLAVAGALGSGVFLLEGGNLTEEYVLPLQWGALYLFARSPWAWPAAAGRKGGRAAALGLGVLLGLAFSLKQTMIGVWVALFIYLGVRLVACREADVWRCAAWCAAGFAVVQAGWAAYFASQGALEAYWSTAFVYNFLYSLDAPEERRLFMLRDLVSFLTLTHGFFTFALAAWLAGIAAAARALVRMGRAALDGPAAGFPLAVALVDVLVEAGLISTSGFNFRHYFLTLLPGFSILAAWGLDRLRALAEPRVPRRGPALALGLLAVVGLFFATCIPQAGRLAAQSPDLRLTATARYVGDHTQPGDPLLVWGTKTTINYLADRDAPSRFVHQKALFREGYANRALSAELLADLRANPPALVIDTKAGGMPFVQIGADGRCEWPERVPEGMGEVYVWVCEHYVLETKITKEGWAVYRYKN